MQIPGITLERLRNGEYFQFFTDVRDIILANNPVALNVKPSYDAFVIERIEIDKLFQQEQGSVITPKIEVADLRRDRALNGINSVVNGFVYHFNPSFSDAALLLQASIGKYGSSIASQNLIAETGTINSLLGDWDTITELKNAIIKLNLVEWINELRDANEQFHQFYMDRNSETAAKTVQSLDERRNLTSNAIYYKLRDKLLANAELNDLAEPWGTAVNQLKAIIASYNTLLGTRPPEPTTPVTPPIG